MNLIILENKTYATGIQLLNDFCLNNKDQIIRILDCSQTTLGGMYAFLEFQQNFKLKTDVDNSICQFFDSADNFIDKLYALKKELFYKNTYAFSFESLTDGVSHLQVYLKQEKSSLLEVQFCHGGINGILSIENKILEQYKEFFVHLNAESPLVPFFKGESSYLEKL